MLRLRFIVSRRFQDSALAGWTVRVEPGDHAPELQREYGMEAVLVGDRYVPVPPPDRRLDFAAIPHGALCAGDPDALGSLLNRVATRQLAGDDVLLYGRWLFECLLAPVWRDVHQHPSVMADRNIEVALEWPVEANELHRLVWEAMHDGQPGPPLAGHPDLLVAFTRLVRGPGTPQPPLEHIPRVLFAAGSAIADPTIRPGAMYVGLLRSLESDGRCRARAIDRVSIEMLRQECVRFGPDVVHLVAHGELVDGRSVLLLRDETGEGEREADAQALVAALTASRRPLAVILSACNTAGGGPEDPTLSAPLAAQLVAAGIPVVSAMAGEVGEPACRLYTRRFTRSLHAGGSLAEASAHGRRAALVAEQPGASIDWALPALFIDADVDPDTPLIHVPWSERLYQIADDLDLRRDPVFIGRSQILDQADRLVDPGTAVRVVAVVNDRSTTGLGGTRLLREIGWRLIRDGHLPLLLGPYQQGSAPTNARELAAEILTHMARFMRLLDIPTFLPYTLQAELDDGGQLASQVANLDDSVLARSKVYQELSRFKARADLLDPDALQNLLAADFLQLARSAAAVGAPFGSDTRVILLCDDVHNWAAPTQISQGAPPSALDALTRMLTASGLGSRSSPVPVVLTGSLTEHFGSALKAWTQNAYPWLRVFALGEFSQEDAVIGFQWLLLHPWIHVTTAEDELLYRSTYTSVPGKLKLWEEALTRVERRPKPAVEREVYLAADLSVLFQSGRRNDDDRAWQEYAKLYLKERGA